MHVLSAGEGYKYLLKSVAVGDGNRSLADPLTRYYMEKGTPPGSWLGGAVVDFGNGELSAGDEVTETHLRLLLGVGCDPLTGEPLGRPWLAYRGTAERITRRVAALDDGLLLADRLEAVSQIEREERARGTRRAVAGYDFTFSVPKSVSVLWALADGGTQALIANAHRAAIRDVLALLEREVAATRVGADSGEGSIIHMDVSGVAATAYDHYDSRTGDPQLHTHVVIANKVRAVHDGRWRTLAGRPMHQAVVALSEHYNAVLADYLTRRLGVKWSVRDRGERRNPGYEIAGVPEALLDEFSRRTHDIEARTEELIAAWREQYGRSPSTRVILRLRERATLDTRPEKQLRSLAELTEEWRARAADRLGESDGWTGRVLAPSEPGKALRTDDVPLDTVDEVARLVVTVTSEKRVTWRRWNLHAETSRQTLSWRFASTTDREALVGMIVDAAERHSLTLTPPEAATTPALFRRSDGTSMFRPRHSTVFSSTAILEAEDRLVALAAEQHGPAVGLEHVGRAARRTLPGGERLSGEQTRAVEAIACSGRVVDLLVGPAGTGKTTTLAGLRAAWERRHGPGSVVGLAPSAAAAEVLAGDLGIGTENTAKWLHEHDHNALRLRSRQLVILDEASLAGTLSLARIAEHAATVGAKLLLAGDPAQLDAVDAGGALALLVAERGDVATLAEVRRFRQPWERAASLALRLGDPAALDAYLAHERVRDGDRDEMVDALYAAWHADTQAGRRSLMIAESIEAVYDLNARARFDRIRAGRVDTISPVRLSDGAEAGRGDVVLTRRNDRRLAVGRGFLKNGDRFEVTATHRDGSLTVRQDRRRGWEVRLPAWYVAEHVELGYAVTVHRAQGATVETAHILIDPARTARESLYVGMTRGRESNVAYVATDTPGLEEHQHPAEPSGAREVLTAVLARVAAEPSAHEAIRVEQDAWGGIAQLAAEYDTLAAAALADRYLGVLHRAGLDDAQLDALDGSESFTSLVAELRRLEAERHDLDALLPAAIGSRPLDDADDLGAVLYRRVQRIAPAGRSRRAPRLIAGLVPAATGVADPEMREALAERHRLIEQRAAALAETALRNGARWTRTLGVRPAESGRADAWLTQARTVAAYRDRYRLDDDRPAGPAAATIAQRLDQARAEAAVRAARRIAADDARAGFRQTAGRRATGPTL